MNQEQEQAQWYARYYSQTSSTRNDLRTNKGVLFQTLAWEASFVRTCYRIGHDAGTAKILDVGCGGANSLEIFRKLGYRPEHFTGLDIQASRLAGASSVYPQVKFVHGDATSMAFPCEEFDLVFESTMFATLADAGRRTQMAGEMLRVCKPGGFLMLMDWRFHKWRNPLYGILSQRICHGRIS